MADDNRYRTILVRLIVSQVAILVIAAASGAGFVFLESRKPDVQTKDITARPLNVDTFNAAFVQFREVLTAFGTARPDREVIVAAQVSGEIVEIHPRLRVGEAVVSPQAVLSANAPTRHEQGDALLRIDPRDFEERAEQTQNRIREATREIEQLGQQRDNSDRQLIKAKEDLTTLNTEHERIQQLVKRKASSPAELNRSLLDLRRYEDTIIALESELALIPHQIAAAKERLATSRSEHVRASTDLERTWVFPPFDGLLSEVSAERGLYVRAGEPLFRLTDPNIIEVPVFVGLDDWQQIASAVRRGDSASVELAPSESAKPQWNGSIVRVAPEADPQSRTIQVFVEVDNSSQRRPLLPGTFLYARIRGQAAQNEIVIPRDAILNDSVFVIDAKNVAHRTPVVTGRYLRSMVVVESGLSGEERIATTNLDILEDGLPVAVQQTSDLREEMRTQKSAVIDLLDPSAPRVAQPTAASDESSTDSLP